MTTGWSVASVPPASARSASPRRIASYASPIACPAVAHALTGPNDGPCALTWIATSPAAMFPMAPGIKNGETRPAPFAAKLSACSKSVVAPPSPEPMMVAVPSACASLSRAGSPAELSASSDAAIAKWAKRSSRLICFASRMSEGSKFGTCPPKSTSCPVRSSPSSRRMPERPARRPLQSASTPRPSGDTAPIPVTTTRCASLIAPSSPCAPLPRDTRHPQARVR